MKNNIDIITISIVGALIIIGGIIILITVIIRSNFTSFHSAVIDLYKSLWNPIIDYSFKVAIVFKNIYWYPLGVDHRIFKQKFKRVENINDSAEIVEVVNPFPIAPKSGYLLLCGTVWGISFYVWYAISHIVETIYGAKADAFVKILPYLLAAVVGLIDTWILKATALTAQKSKIVPMGMLRFAVSSCIASIAMFHFLTVEYSTDIQQAANKRQYELAEKSTEYANLIVMRDELVKAHYESDGKKECSSLLKTGSKDSNTVKKFSKNKYLDIMDLYKTPVERNGHTKLSLPIGVSDIDCRSLFVGEEVICPDAKAHEKLCPHLTQLATEGFVMDVKTFGTSMAVSRYWYGVAAVFPDLMKSPVSFEDSDRGKFEALQKKIFPSDFSEKSTKDLRIAADTVSKKIFDEAWITIFLLTAPIIVLSIYEFLIIIIKATWGTTSLDIYLKKVDAEIRHNLETGVLGEVAKADLKYSSDFSMQDHIGRIFSSVKKFLEPLVQSPILAGILIAALALIVTIFVLADAQTVLVGMVDWVTKRFSELLKLKVCPWLGVSCKL